MEAGQTSKATGLHRPSFAPCNRHVIDTHRDHIHTCKKRTGSTKDAHETILDALENICNDSGLSTHRHNIPSVRKVKGRTGRGDLVIKDVNRGDRLHMIVDVVFIHEFYGNHLADESCNGQLRDPDVNKLL